MDKIQTKKMLKKFFQITSVLLVISLVILGIYRLGPERAAQASAVVISSAGTVTNPTGRPTQNHLIYAVNDAAWWMFYIDGTTTTLQTKRSTDLVTWTAKNSLTLANSNGGEGLNFAVAYKNISSNDVVHLQISYRLSDTSKKTYNSRATISAAQITFGAEAQLDTSQTLTNTYTIDGPSIEFDSNNKVFASYNWISDGGGVGREDANISTNADLGSSWTAGFAGYNRIDTPNNPPLHRKLLPLASGNMIDIYEDNKNGDTWANIRWSKWTTVWSAAATVRGTNLTSFQVSNDFGVVRISDTDIRLIMRTESNTYEGFKFNGSAWSIMTAPGTQTSKAGGGMFLATDGTDFWLFIIDSDAANTIRYNKFTVSAGTWGGWTALETTTQTRSFLSGYSVASGGNIALIWTQVNGANFDIVTEALNISSVTPRSATTPSEKVRGGLKVRGGVKFR